MASIFFLRHQAGNVLHEYPFASPPTDEQKEALERLCIQRHGVSHAKTPGEPYWMRVVEVPLLGDDDVPSVPELSLSVVSEAGVPKIAVSATGTVTPPKEG